MLPWRRWAIRMCRSLKGTPGDLIIYPGATGRTDTFLPGGNATTRALYECNFARAGLQINAAGSPHRRPAQITSRPIGVALYAEI